MNRVVALAIPYKNFKEKIRIVKGYTKNKNNKIAILDNFIYVEVNYDE